MASPERPASDQAPTHASATPAEAPPPSGAPEPPRPESAAPSPGRRRWLFRGVGGLALLLILFEGVPWVRNALRTVSTDDAYVNGHVTFVAARVPGQVARVLVDDNNRVHTGDLLVQLDREPYQVLVNIAQASVDAAQANFVAAEAEARGIEGQARSLRFNLQNAIEEVDNQVALLRSRVAGLDSYKAAVAKAQADYDRALPLVRSGSITAEELDHRKQALRDAQAQLEAALQGIYQIRASLGLPPRPPTGDDLAQVPPDLEPDLLHRAGSASEAHPDDGAARREHPVRQIAPADDHGLLQARSRKATSIASWRRSSRIRRRWRRPRPSCPRRSAISTRRS